LKSAEEWIKSVVKDNGTYFDTCELDGGTWHESVALVVEAETLIASLQANVAMLKGAFQLTGECKLFVHCPLH